MEEYDTMAWEKGTITGTMVLSPKPPSRNSAGYDGLEYTPYVIDEKKENGKYQVISVPSKWQINIDGTGWVDGRSASYDNPSGGGDGTETYTMEARHLISYKYGKYYYKTSTSTKYEGWLEEVPSTVWDPKDGLTNNALESKTCTTYSSSDSRDVPDEDGAYKDEDGNWVKDETTGETVPADKDEPGAYESPPGSGNWFKYVETTTTVPSSGHTEYEVTSTTTKYTLTLEIIDDSEEERSPIYTISPFYPAPPIFQFNYIYTGNEIRLYVGEGVTYTVSNLWTFKSFASQYIAWQTQSASSCTDFSGRYLNASNLNSILYDITLGEESDHYSSGDTITLGTFDYLASVINSG